MSTHVGFPRIDIVDVPGKGKGVIALEHIPRGTMIISEKPRITLPAVLPTAMRSNWVAASLSPDDREFLLSFPCGPDEDAILGRMKHFTPCLGDGTVGGSRNELISPCNTATEMNCIPVKTPGSVYCGLLDLVNRLNHLENICLPFANIRKLNGKFKRFYRLQTFVNENGWSLNARRSVARITFATLQTQARTPPTFGTSGLNEKDIRKGQEIEVSYMENAENYRNPWAHLRETFGFECSCCGCTRPDAERKASEKRIYAYNDFVIRLPGRFGKENPLLLLKDIEEQILVICEEGYTGEIQARAHDAFQLCAYYGDADSARQWEAICRDRHALYQGVNTEPYENAKKLAAKPQDFRAWGGLGRRKLRGPPAASNTASTSTAIPSSAQAQKNDPSITTQSAPSTNTPPGKLSKGQKKNARAKAKKAAAKQAEETPE
ncbi:hypothetical protein C8R43DRAFT_953042 [Mycena crocata]|nr:hypothetical protein C8R43DRAFT_953042 [Mycena crocata]